MNPYVQYFLAMILSLGSAFSADGTAAQSATVARLHAVRAELQELMNQALPDIELERDIAVNEARREEILHAEQAVVMMDQEYKELAASASALAVRRSQPSEPQQIITNEMREIALRMKERRMVVLSQCLLLTERRFMVEKAGEQLRTKPRKYSIEVMQRIQALKAESQALLRAIPNSTKSGVSQASGGGR